MAVIHPPGTIVWVKNVPDQNGVNHKERPVILIQAVNTGDVKLLGIAVTHSLTRPQPDTHFSLQFASDSKNAKTGLTSPSDAVCEWTVAATTDQISGRSGFVIPATFVKIMECMRSLDPPS